MITKRLVLFLQFFFLTGNIYTSSMPAYPKKVSIKVEGGEVYIQLLGDEHSKRAENIDGYTIIQKNGEWHFAEKDSNGKLIPSAHKLTANITDSTKQFLKTISPHLTNEANQKSSETRKSSSFTQHSQKVIGERKVLVILMQYKDLLLIKSPDDFNELFNGIGYDEDGAQGSVCDYFSDVSYGQLQLTCDIIGPFTSANSWSYYGKNDRDGNDSNATELFTEAIAHAADLVSLEDYDSNKDGYVDNIHIIFAGHGEEAGASSDAIWSHETQFFEPVEIHGMKIDKYSCAPELRSNKGNGISRIGPHCHEIGHALGAMDYYDTDKETGGNYLGTGVWDVMASGSWNNDGISPADFNPYVKAYNFEWISPRELPSGEVTIQPSYIGPEHYYRLGSSYSSDYYLIENRSKERWGYGVPGEGLLVYHIHSEINNADNHINTTTPQKCYLVCASSKSRLPGDNPSSYGAINTDGCPYPGTTNNTNFGQGSIPVAFFWNDEECNIELNQISIDGLGSIHLENNSINEEETERRKIFFEGFEENEVKITISKGESSKFSSTWAIESDPQGPSKFPTRPSAYKGTRCLQLSAKKSAEVTSMFSFTIPEPADIDSCMIKLKFFANTFNPPTDQNNKLQINYRTRNSEEWQHREIQPSGNNHWTQYIVDLPNNIAAQIQVEGTAYSGSVLAIDNLEVEQIKGKNESAIDNIQTNVNKQFYLYNLSGIKQTTLQRGLFVIRDSEGEVHKILYK